LHAQAHHGRGRAASAAAWRHCAALRGTALHGTALRCAALHGAALRCTALHGTALLCAARHCGAGGQFRSRCSRSLSSRHAAARNTNHAVRLQHGLGKHAPLLGGSVGALPAAFVCEARDAVVRLLEVRVRIFRGKGTHFRGKCTRWYAFPNCAAVRMLEWRNDRSARRRPVGRPTGASVH
jgi:hypothetical protein